MPAWASSAKRDGTASGMKPATALIQAASLVLRSIGARQSAATRNCAKALDAERRVVRMYEPNIRGNAAGQAFEPG